MLNGTLPLNWTKCSSQQYAATWISKYSKETASVEKLLLPKTCICTLNGETLENDQEFLVGQDLVVCETMAKTQSSRVSHQPLPVWNAEMESIQELIEVEPEAKWALLSFVDMAMTMDAFSTDKFVELTGPALEYIDKLTTIDPLRLNYYRYLSKPCRC